MSYPLRYDFPHERDNSVSNAPLVAPGPARQLCVKSPLRPVGPVFMSSSFLSASGSPLARAPFPLVWIFVHLRPLRFPPCPVRSARVQPVLPDFTHFFFRNSLITHIYPHQTPPPPPPAPNRSRWRRTTENSAASRDEAQLATFNPARLERPLQTISRLFPP